MNIRIQIVGGTDRDHENLNDAMCQCLTKLSPAALQQKDAHLRNELLRAPVSCESNNTEQLLVLANALREIRNMPTCQAAKYLQGQLPNLSLMDCQEFMNAAYGLVGR